MLALRLCFKLVAGLPQGLTAVLEHLQLPVAEVQRRVGCKIYKFKV